MTTKPTEPTTVSVFDTRRRQTVTVTAGNVTIGSGFPVRLQSMTNTSTMDTDGSVEQCTRIVAAGAELVRLTAQGVRESMNLGEIRRQLRQRGIKCPLVADIHFNRQAAFAAIDNVEKVRINPGNFIDPGRTFKKLEYTDEEYAAELERLDSVFSEFLEKCSRHGTAIRLGVNHGSLSDRIMSRFGDTPAGIVESAMEFLRVAVKRNFLNIVVSIKASNVMVMVESVRRLTKAMNDEGMHFPLHLGVTEAGDGTTARVKSAVGIGCLLSEGIGDTIRVSLSEAPEAELPVARMLRDYIATFYNAPEIPGHYYPGYDPIIPPIGKPGENIMVVGTDSTAIYDEDRRPDSFETYPEIDAANLPATLPAKTVVITTSHPNFPGSVNAAIHSIIARGENARIIIKGSYRHLTPEEITIRAAVDLGSVIMRSPINGIMIDTGGILSPAAEASLAFEILQATRRRITRTEFIACPGCGRTLFDLQSTLKAVKEATAHLHGLKIGVMGCVVNGPGEMADADYGYVGAGIGKVSLYRGKECVSKNIPADEALQALIKLLQHDGVWHNP